MIFTHVTRTVYEVRFTVGTQYERTFPMTVDFVDPKTAFDYLNTHITPLVADSYDNASKLSRDVATSMLRARDNWMIFYPFIKSVEGVFEVITEERQLDRSGDALPQLTGNEPMLPQKASKK